MREIQLITKDRSWWPIDWAYLRGVTLSTLFYSDDVRVRWLMALASLGWAVTLTVDPQMMDRRFYLPMQLGGLTPWWVWAACFLGHGVGAIWRIYERRERVGWGLAINGLGVMVWTACTILQNIGSLDHFTATSVLECIACLFLLDVFISTGFSSKSTTA